MPRLLIIDTSAALGTVVLVNGPNRAVRQIRGARSHGQSLLGLIEELLDEQGIVVTDLTALAVVAGPGSFTGIRIGIGITQGLSAALDIPVILLSSLEWLARSAIDRFHTGQVVVCRKARASEYYFCCYRDKSGEGDPVNEEGLFQASEIVTVLEELDRSAWLAVGDGWQDTENFDAELLRDFELVDEFLEGDVGTLCQLAAEKLEQGRAVAASQVMPSYLKETMDYNISKSK